MEATSSRVLTVLSGVSGRGPLAAPPASVRAMRRVVLVGGGGHASDVLSVIEALVAAGEAIRVVGLLADSEVGRERFAGRDVEHLGPVATLAELDAEYVLAIGYPVTRRAVHSQV